MHSFLLALFGAIQDALERWLRGPRKRPTRYVIVPDFTGKPASQRFEIAAQAGVRTQFIRLIEPPAPVEGLIVAQTPQTGTKVRRNTLVVLSIFHEPDMLREDTEAPSPR